MNEYKVCQICNTELPIQKFPFKRGNFQDQCLGCQNDTQRRAKKEQFDNQFKDQEDRMWEEYYFYDD